MSFLDDQLDDMMLQHAIGLKDEDDKDDEENVLPENFYELGYDEY
jgi:hypothetical protein